MSFIGLSQGAGRTGFFWKLWEGNPFLPFSASAGLLGSCPLPPSLVFITLFSGCCDHFTLASWLIFLALLLQRSSWWLWASWITQKNLPVSQSLIHSSKSLLPAVRDALHGLWGLTGLRTCWRFHWACPKQDSALNKTMGTIGPGAIGYHDLILELCLKYKLLSIILNHYTFF